MPRHTENSYFKKSEKLSGFTGKGVRVTILDDGIERTHPDLMRNYDGLSSFDVNGNDEEQIFKYKIKMLD